jgi:5-methyltetrahydropteroyltriglutamate--homocysteine methyltransferase
VLGLVSIKDRALETVDGLARRVDEASRYCELSRLAISPQCGFSSAAEGNNISAEQQAAKLRRVVEAAERIWG